MAGRRTNLALLGALGAALVTGGLAYGIGSGWNRWAVVSHALAGLAVIALAPWKSLIVRRGLRKGRPGRDLSIALGVLVVTSAVAGLAHSTGLARTLGPVTAMQIHVGAALLAMPLAVWHVVARPQRPQRADFRRRRLLRAGGIVGAAGAGYLFLEGLGRLASSHGSSRRHTGSYERGSFSPRDMPVTQWLDDSVPGIDAAAWRLEVADRSMSYDDVAAFDDRVEAVLDCTGGWYARQQWAGVRLDRLLPAGARSIVVHSVTGYGRAYPMADAPKLLLATRLGGAPLSEGHGFPARIVAPNRRGFWWVKWVERIEVSEVPWWLQLPFPLT